MNLFEQNSLEPTLKKDLQPINNLKVIFRSIRSYFAGNSVGITRDETIARNLMRVLFCKIYDEEHTKSDEPLKFVYKKSDTPLTAYKKLTELFLSVKKSYPEIFKKNEKFDFTVADTPFIMRPLQGYRLLDANRDIVADAFEELIGTTFRGNNGQFFTPRNIVQMIIDVLQPKEGEKILDPACGTGGFLAYVTRSIKNNENAFIYGIDKDTFLSELAKIYLTLLGNFKGDIACENSLERTKKWGQVAQKNMQLESFDAILTNPPFGAKIPIVGAELLSQYELGHVWKKDKNGNWMLTSDLLDKQPPQILFIERIVQFLKPGGRAAIVLPDGVFGNPTDAYIWDYLKKYVSVVGVISLSHETFQPSTHTKTSVLFIEKKLNSRKDIFMAVAHNVGHDKNGKAVYKIDENGNKILDDDTPEVAKNFQRFLAGENLTDSILGFVVNSDDIKNNIYIPESYWKTLQINKKYESLQKSSIEITIGDLEKEGVISIKRGNEIGSRNYGTGNIPFVRTTDIVNWEIKTNPAKAVSDSVYQKFAKLQDVRKDDILFVNDGTFLIGRSAMVSRLDEKSVIQSHIRKIRIEVNKYGITPYYLFYLLNTDYVQQQISSKIFTQATLSTLGNRLLEIKLPVLKDINEIEKISKQVLDIIDKKTVIRNKINKLFDA